MLFRTLRVVGVPAVFFVGGVSRRKVSLPVMCQRVGTGLSSRVVIGRGIKRRPRVGMASGSSVRR